ncbi:MAG: PilT/PilU family type 4a pilus ATPase [Verrucomicrobia bacterium]|nr:PilT/PilU family type 4a pilus ATPase [Verrucomicrobiota bacterium]
MELLHRVLSLAVEAGASDVHVKIGVPVVFRINRNLVNIECPIPTTQWMDTIAGQIVPKHARSKYEEDHEADFSYHLPGVGRFRANLFQQRGELCLAMRYVKAQVPGFEDLGLLPILKKFAEAPRGIVLLAGTTGSGKSTTLAAMIEHINSHQRRHIITMEDPIEYVFEDNQCLIEQREVGLDTASFHTALRNVLRQDPDVIMIGEMRDAISLGAAMSASDTGHLVLSTVHTTNSAQSIIRILDFFRADDREQVRRQLAGTLLAVITQRMVATVDSKVTVGLEILINTPVVRKMIEENRLDKLSAAIETGTEDGMQSFNQAFYTLCMQGKITKEEALNKATNPQALEMNFKGIFLDEGRRILGA